MIINSPNITIVDGLSNWRMAETLRDSAALFITLPDECAIATPMAAIVTATPKAKRRLRFRASPYELTPVEERHTARALGQGTIPKRNPTRER
jgi:hypothetical protein